MQLTVSVVVPTYNRCDRLHRVLTALAAQTFPRTSFEVIVVSDGSTDGTDEYLRSDRPPLQLVAVMQPNRGPGPARNAGVERARGRLILFVDDDVVAAPDLVEGQAVLENGEVELLGKPFELNELFDAVARLTRSPGELSA